MASVQLIVQGGVQVLLLELVDIRDGRSLPSLVDEAIRLGQSAAPAGSLRTLLDLTGTRISADVVASLKRLSRNNGRFARATAFVGIGGAWSTTLGLVFRATGRKNHRVFRRRDDALRWLEQQ
jgi:hypothetical protein